MTYSNWKIKYEALVKNISDRAERLDQQAEAADNEAYTKRDEAWALRQLLDEAEREDY